MVKQRARVVQSRIRLFDSTARMRRSSLVGPGQVAGLLLGGIGFASWAQESDPSQIGMAGTVGALLGLWLGGKIGGLWVRDRPLYRSSVPRFAASDSATAGPVGAPVPKGNPDAWAIWIVPQAVLGFPQGAFRPVGSDRIDGAGGVITFAPPHFPIGLRLSLETATSRGRQSGVIAPVFGPTPVDVRTSNRIDWLMVGPLWDSRPRKSSIYLFAAGGLVRVTPKGSAQWGTGILGVPLTYDMPGLPPSGTGFAASAGAGVRVVFGRARKLALAAELDYRHAGATYYLGAPGSEGSPDPRFSARYDAIDVVAIRLGLAASWDRRFATGP